MKFKLFLSLIIVCLSCALFADSLSDYIAKDDGAYSYKLVNTQLSSDSSVSISHITFTSQEWQGNKLNHTMDIYYPSTATVKGTALMLVVNGEYDSEWLQSATYMASFMQSPIVVLYNDSSDDKYFDTLKDAWGKILKDKNYFDCPYLFASVKTIFKAMDTVGNITHEIYDTPIDYFVVCGGGLSAHPIWLASTLNDHRIKGMIPTNFDQLNMIEQLKDQKESLGSVSESVIDFTAKNFDNVDNNPYVDFLKLVDPYNNISNITTPKLIISGTGDSFTTIDAAKSYYDKLPEGENHLYLAVNESTVWPAGNAYKYSSMSNNTDLLNTVKSFFYSVTQDKKYEDTKFEWVKTDKGYTLNIKCNPTSVVAAYSYVCDSENKDFRYANFSKKTLEMDNSQYKLDVQMPSNSHRCAFVEIQYTSEIGVNYSEYSIPFILK